MVLVDQPQKTTTRAGTSRASDGMMRDRVVNDPRGEVPSSGALPPTGQPKVADSASGNPASPTKSSPSMAIGQFLKRIRTRSKSPASAANKKPSSSLSANGLSNHPSTSASSPAWKESQDTYTNGYHTTPDHPPPRQISTQYSSTNASHLSSGNIASNLTTKSSTVPRAQSQDGVDAFAVTPARRTAPSRSSSRSRLKNWLSGSTDDDGVHHSGKLSSWIGAKFSKDSPLRKSSAKRHADSTTNPPAVYGAAATLRDQAQRGALSEEDLVSKSLASEILSKGSGVPEIPNDPSSGARTGTTNGPDGAMLTSYYSQDSVFDGPQKVPSYVRVSCALNGYRRFRPSLPPSPLSPAGVASPRLSDGQPTGLQTTPKGQSIVERRLERFNQPETPPKSAGGPGNSDRIKSAGQNNSSVKKLVGNFDRSDDRQSNSNKSHDGESHHQEGGAHSAVTNSDQDSESHSRNSSAVAEAGSLDNGHGPTGGNSSSLDTEAMVLTGGFSQKEEEEGSLLAEVLKATEQLMSTDGVEDSAKMSSLNGKSIEPESSSPVEGGRVFEKLAAEERVKLEKKLAEAAQELENDQIPSEGLDLIRIAYGKGKLLLNKKFSKYEELIQKNLHPIPNDPQPTKLDDLEGYWQLVKMELEDIDSHFDDYYRVKNSGWDFSKVEQNGVTEPPKKPASKPRGTSAKAKKPPVPPTGPNKEARDRLRAAKLDAKKRMMEQQAKLKAAAEENGKGDEIQIFVPV